MALVCDDESCPVHVKTWHGIKYITFGSMTVAWTYLLLVGSAAMEVLLAFPDVDLQFNLGQFVPPKWLPVYTAAIAGLTLVARLRSIVWRQDRVQDYIRERTDPEARDGIPTQSP